MGLAHSSRSHWSIKKTTKDTYVQQAEAATYVCFKIFHILSSKAAFYTYEFRQVMELILSQYDRFHTSKMPLLNSSSCSRKQCLCLMRAHYLDTATAVTAKEEKKKASVHSVQEHTSQKKNILKYCHCLFPKMPTSRSILTYV